MGSSELDISVELDRRMRFETLVSELSSRFVNLPVDRVGYEIEDAQRRICGYLGLDRSTLWQQPESAADSLELTHIYQSADAPAVPAQADARALFPWSVRKLRQGEAITVARLDDLPGDAARDRESWDRYGTKSTILLPLSVGGEAIGVMSFASVREERDWPEPVVQQLQLICQVLANAIARARSDRSLQESRERYALAVDGTNDGLWDWDLRTDKVYFSPRWKSMLGFEDGEMANAIRAWEELLHPADRDKAQAALESCASGQAAAFELEYRLRCKDGQYRWILARGKALWDAQGRPYRVAGSHIDITGRKQDEERLREACEQLNRLREQLEQQNVYLRQEVRTLHGQSRVIGQSRAIQRVLMQAEQVAPMASTVLLLGETGTGKELIASIIHDMSPRRERVMVRVNCSAIPATLIESELFGREKGAYTGALSKQVGRFEAANESTLFLDEVGELPPDVQVKLLRVLQDKKIERLGSPRSIDVDVRIIAATNQDLEKAVRSGRFRQDLYYRLNVFPITVPPLRDRREDIPPLVSAFVAEFAAAFGKNIEVIDRDSMHMLQQYLWPGNVRELRNVIERAMIVARGPRLYIDLPDAAASALTPSLTIRENEHQLIRHVLDMTGWRIRGKNGAAEILGLKPTTLESRMARLGIRRGGPDATK